MNQQRPSTPHPSLLLAAGALAGAAGAVLIGSARRPVTAPPSGQAGTVIRIAAGSALPRVLVSGTVGKPTQYVLAGGAHPASPRYQSGQDHDIEVSGEPGAKIVAPKSVMQCLGFSGVHRLTVRNLELTGAAYGFFCNRASSDVRLESLVIHDCDDDGILFGAGRNYTVTRCRISRIAKEHGAYFSETEQGIEFTDNLVEDSPGSAVQLNGHGDAPGDPWASQGVVARNVVRRTGSKGGAAFNLLCVRNSRIENNRAEAFQAGGINLGGDGTSRGSKENVFTNNILVGIAGKGHGVSIERVCQRNTLSGTQVSGTAQAFEVLDATTIDGGGNTAGGKRVAKGTGWR